MVPILTAGVLPGVNPGQKQGEKFPFSDTFSLFGGSRRETKGYKFYNPPSDFGTTRVLDPQEVPFQRDLRGQKHTFISFWSKWGENFVAQKGKIFGGTKPRRNI